MRILADENIPFVRQAFSGIGEVKTLPCRRIDNQALREADVLLVRSTLKVDQSLLEGTPVKFVATATIGIDHIDADYLESRNIGFASAAGCNANSVAEYVFAALFDLSQNLNFHLQEMTIGVVGVGNVGSRVVRMAEGLGMKVLQNDPPLQRQTGDPRFVPLDDLMQADILTIHVPLTRQGEDATFHLFGEERLTKMKSGGILLNTSRGPVVAGDALKKLMRDRYFKAVLLDVWENEPDIDVELLRSVDIGTPHIAGYSFDGKVNGTTMIYRAVCRHLGIEPGWDAAKLMPKAMIPWLQVSPDEDGDDVVLHRLIRQIYDIRRDDGNLRRMSAMPPADHASYFEKLRKDYPVRREFFNTRIDLTRRKPSLESKFTALGFQLK